MASFASNTPFPEYTSGHSVISSAAAIALTHIYGDNFSFDDTTEEKYGLPMRSFNSFSRRQKRQPLVVYMEEFTIDRLSKMV